MATDMYMFAERRDGGGWASCGRLKDLEPSCYEFFAIVANVRNPIRSTEPFDVIALPRGLPDDLSSDLRRDALLHSGHDAGWLMLRELLDFDWNGKTILRSAVVDSSVGHLFGDGRQRFPGDRRAAGWSTAEDGRGPRVTWIDTYRQAVGEAFLNDLFTTLARIGPTDDVRIVFSFDS